ncbi:hypothetical protein [Streptomyces sp. Da 82-17]
MDRVRDWSWVRHWSDLLQHDEVWCNAQGEILRLDDMDADSAAACTPS